MELNKNLLKIIEIIESHPSVIAIYLFGSHVKGEATPLSDIDIPIPESEADIGSLSSPEIDVVLFHRLSLAHKIRGLQIRKGDIPFKTRKSSWRLSYMREYLDTVRMYKMIIIRGVRMKLVEYIIRSKDILKELKKLKSKDVRDYFVLQHARNEIFSGSKRTSLTWLNTYLPIESWAPLQHTGSFRNT